MSQQLIDSLDQRASSIPPKKEGLYVVAVSGKGASTITTRATLMGNIITSPGPLNGKTMGDIQRDPAAGNLYRWYGPFRNWKDAETIVTHVNEKMGYIGKKAPEAQIAEGELEKLPENTYIVKGLDNPEVVDGLKKFAVRSNNPKVVREVIQQLVNQVA